MRLIEILGRNSTRNFMYNWDTCHFLARSIEQMHAVSARDEKAMGVAHLVKPLNHLVCMRHLVAPLSDIF